MTLCIILLSSNLIFSNPTGDDFSTLSRIISVPANTNNLEIPQFFSIVDDNLDEDEQSFAIVAEIGRDVPDGLSCFQTAEGGTECHGRRGATEIRITDNDGRFCLL